MVYCEDWEPIKPDVNNIDSDSSDDDMDVQERLNTSLNESCWESDTDTEDQFHVNFVDDMDDSSSSEESLCSNLHKIVLHPIPDYDINLPEWSDTDSTATHFERWDGSGITNDMKWKSETESDNDSDS